MCNRSTEKAEEQRRGAVYRATRSVSQHLLDFPARPASRVGRQSARVDRWRNRCNNAGEGFNTHSTAPPGDTVEYIRVVGAAELAGAGGAFAASVF